MPMASLCAPSATYSPRSAGSAPSSIATTLVAPTSLPSKVTSPWIALPVSPGLSWSSGLPNSFGTLAVGRMTSRGWVTPGGTCRFCLTSMCGVRNSCSKVAMSVSTPVTAIPATDPSFPSGPRSGTSSVVPLPLLLKTTTFPWSASRAGTEAESAAEPMYTTSAPLIGRAGTSNCAW